MTTITFDAEGKPTIHMMSKDVLPLATATYLDSIKQRSYVHSDFLFFPIELFTETVASVGDGAGFRRELFQSVNESLLVFKITDYTLTSIPKVLSKSFFGSNKGYRLSGTGIAFRPEVLNTKYEEFKNLKRLGVEGDDFQLHF